MKNTTYWSAFAGGVSGATAYGGPTNAMFVNSWNENATVNSKILSVETYTVDLIDSSKLYIPYTEKVEECYGYWLVSPCTSNTKDVWDIHYRGYLDHSDLSNGAFGVRPIVCLPSEITGTIGSSVSIDK